MELHPFQKEMWLCVKKYLLPILKRRSLTLSIAVRKNGFSIPKKLKSLKKQDPETDHSWTAEVNATLKEIININEKQKAVLAILRKPSLTTEKGNTQEDDSRMTKSDTHEIENELYSLNLFKAEDSSPVANLLDDPCKSPEESLSDAVSEDIHDLVTHDEYMHSLGLLTQKESNDVLKVRRDKQRKTANWHVFSPAIWEKQETKRKRRDWLVSGSPPQLRRKTTRPNSAPSSRQTSRGASPLEGSSSPSSSLSSPSSPSYNPEGLEESCPECKQKGTTLQCDGCGIHYHTSCVVFTDEGTTFHPRWLCAKCIQMGIRAPPFHDPLQHHKVTKSNDKKKVGHRR